MAHVANVAKYFLLLALRDDKHVKFALCTDHISRRFEALIDFVDTEIA
jgi:hypothetical protein